MEMEINLTEEEYAYVIKNSEWANNEDFPSEEFSLLSKIDNLHTDWIIDKSIEDCKFLNWKLFFLTDIKENDEEYSFILNEGRKALSLRMYNQLILDNPILAEISADTYAEKLDIVHGAVSKFLYDDIKHFVENRDTIIEYNQTFFPIARLIEEKTSIIVEWVMSPQTLVRVLNTLNIPTPPEINFLIKFGK